MDSTRLADRIHTDSTVLADRIHADSVTVMDTLHRYYATKDTLKNFLTINGLCDSVMSCDGIETMRDSIQQVNARLTLDSTRLADRIHTDSTVLADRIHADSVTVMDTLHRYYATKDTLKNFVKKTDLCKDVMACDGIQNMRDSIQKVNNRMTYDSTKLADRILADSTALAHRMDTLLKHVCDSVQPCVTSWIKDSLKVVRGKMHNDSLTLATRIFNDSTKLQANIDTVSSHIRAIIPTVSDATVAITVNSNATPAGSFTLNQSADKTIDLQNVAVTNAPNTFTAANDFTNGSITVPSNENAIPRPTPTTVDCNNNMNAVNVCDLLAVFDSLSRRIDSLTAELNRIKNTVPPTVSLTLSDVRSNSIKATAAADGHGTPITSYQFCISENSNMNNPTCSAPISENNYTFENLTGNKTYYVMVRATNVAGASTATASERTPANKPIVTTLSLDDTVPAGFIVNLTGINLKESENGTITICYKEGTDCPADAADTTCVPAVAVTIPVGSTADTTFTILNLNATTAYCVFVTVDNGDSIWSGHGNVTTGVAVVLNVEGPENDTAYICGLSGYQETGYKAKLVGANPSDYNFVWTVPGADADDYELTSNGDSCTVIFKSTLGPFEVKCTATPIAGGSPLEKSVNTEVDWASVPTVVTCTEDYEISIKEELSENVASMDWGDGTTNSETSHTYQTVGSYTIMAISEKGCEATNEVIVTGDKTIRPCHVNTVHNGSDYQSNGWQGKNDGFETPSDTNANYITTVTDYDGNVYPVVQIGSQCWLAENMRCTHSPSGEHKYLVINLSGNAAIKNSRSKVAHWYDNDSTVYAPKHLGLLYNWCAAVDTFDVSQPEVAEGNLPGDGTFDCDFSTVHRRGICPKGWHVPTSDEWTTMEEHVNDNSITGTGWRGAHAGKLSNGCDWHVESYTANAPSDYRNSNRNASGFGALPAGAFGQDYSNVVIEGYMFDAYFWTSETNWESNYRRLEWSKAGALLSTAVAHAGMSVRCVRDEASIPSETALMVTPSDTSVCANEAVTFTATINAGEVGDFTYSWSDGTNVLSTETTCTVSYSTSGSYSVTCTATHTDEGYELTATGSVTIVSGVPYFTFAVDTTSVIIKHIGEGVSITDWGGAGTASNIGVGSSGTYTYSAPGVYTITATNNNGCTATKKVAVGNGVNSTLHPCVVTASHPAQTGSGEGHESTTASSQDSITSVTDYDGNVYPVVQIGTQCWIKSNLRTRHFSNGIDVTNGADYRYENTHHKMVNATSKTTPYYYRPESNSTFRDYDIELMFADIYSPHPRQVAGPYSEKVHGLYYNWPAVMDERGLCPHGWHVPSEAEWNTMIGVVVSQYGGQEGNYAHLLAEGNDWNDGSLLVEKENEPGWFASESRNASEFSAIRTGFSGGSNNEEPINNEYGYSASYARGAFLHRAFAWAETYFWSSSSVGSEEAVSMHLAEDSTRLISKNRYRDCGYSVRCVRDGEGGDSPVVPTTSCSVTTPGDNETQGENNTITAVKDYNNEHSYSVIQIGSQCWMAENMRSTKYTDGNSVSGKYAPDNSESNVAEYGYLYDFSAAMHGSTTTGAQGICPVGWHMPSKAELETMMNNGGFGTVAKAGFFTGTYDGFASEVGFWSTTQGEFEAYKCLWYDNNSFLDFEPEYAVSVRCVRDSEGEVFVCGTSTVSDADGNSYATVAVGEQCWMAENMRNRSYSISGAPTLSNNISSFNANGAYYGYPGNNSNNEDNYGLLYNWYAAMGGSTESGAQGICPDGWHIPTESDILTLIGGQQSGNLPDGFNTQLAGFLWNDQGQIDPPYDVDGHAYYWSSTPSSTNKICYLQCNSDGTAHRVQTGHMDNKVAYAYSVRCVKDGGGSETPTNSCTVTTPGANEVSDENGTITAVKDAELNSYSIVQIGNHCWMAENLRSTNYNGMPSTAIIGIYPPDGDEDNVPYYGYLYNWSAVMNGSTTEGVQGVCPSGWHVPSSSEITALSEITVGDVLPGKYNGYSYSQFAHTAAFWSSTQYDMDDESAGAFVKVGQNVNDSQSWTEKTNGLSVRCVRNEDGGSTSQTDPTVTNETVSSITETTATLSASITNPDDVTITAKGFVYKETTGTTWISVAGTGEGDTIIANLTGLTTSTEYTYKAFVTFEDGADTGSVATFTTLGFVCGTSTMSDVDDNTYNTVQIGNQCWMKSNLRTTKYADGTPITNGGNISNISTTTPYYYDYNPFNYDLPVVSRGYLYNWAALMNGAVSSNTNPSNVQGVCPTGWHVPSRAEWVQLKNYLGSNSEYWCGNNPEYIARALASTTTGWGAYGVNCAPGENFSANNASQFTAIPTDYIEELGGYIARFWTSMKVSDGEAFYYSLAQRRRTLDRSYENIENALSVRCVKDEEGSGTAQISPSVTTGGYSAVTQNTATLSATITNDDDVIIIGRGFKYKADGESTYQDVYTTVELADPTVSYTASIDNLNPGTTYFYYAYITYQGGTVTDESGERSFLTTPESTGFVCGTSTVLDADGNEYTTVEIGSQCWMAENLRTIGNLPPLDEVAVSSGVPEVPFYYQPAEDFEDYDLDYNETYGLYYNRYAALGNDYSGPSGDSEDPTEPVQGICPSGWHIPSKSEWVALVNEVTDDPSYGAGKLSGGTDWEDDSYDEFNYSNPGNYNYTLRNSTLFSALPAGWYDISWDMIDDVYPPKEDAFFWSSSFDDDDTYYFHLQYETEGFDIDTTNDTYAFPVRCVRDSE
ncbi:MAG: hypothetical protein J6P65_08845 [Bacteroidales bacterium]|nr:hypothetical protein [Bacteroidales bacterium]